MRLSRLVVPHPVRATAAAVLLATTLALPALTWAADPTPSASPDPSAVTGPPAALLRARMPDAPEGVPLVDVIAGGPGFIAVGGGFTAGSDLPTAEIWTSVDGAEWARVALEGDAAVGQIRAITRTADGFIAVGGRCCPDQSLIWRSPDGLAWDLAPELEALADTAMLGVCTLPDGAVVAVGCSAVMECFSGLAWRSPDGGLTWEAAVPLAFVPSDVAAAAGGVVAVGTRDPYAGPGVGAASVDGTSWIVTDLGVADGWLSSLLGYPAGALAVGAWRERQGDDLSTLLGGTDGLEWQTMAPASIANARFEDAVWLGGTPMSGSGVLVAAGTRDGDRPAAWWTADALTWTAIDLPSGEGTIQSVAVGPEGVLVAVGEAGGKGPSTMAAWVGADAGR